MSRIRTIYHGIDVRRYQFRSRKSDYLSFIGRFAPCKGAHIAIAIAKRAGIPLKLAGEIQTMYPGYYEREIKPNLDGRFIEYIGAADFAAKNELLANSRAMLFPVQWDEPFGLVMIEAMACGTPVLALSRGSVPEVVCSGVSGYVCESTDEILECLQRLSVLEPERIHQYVESHFSVESMARRYLDTYCDCMVSNRLAPQQR
jgi:glycosyltransferase involved in cell wall biosynthesis